MRRPPARRAAPRRARGRPWTLLIGLSTGLINAPPERRTGRRRRPFPRGWTVGATVYRRCRTAPARGANARWGERRGGSADRSEAGIPAAPPRCRTSPSRLGSPTRRSPGSSTARDSVSDETRARVLQAIEELGYRRNSAARALVTRRSQVLGVVGFDTTLYGPASTLFGIEQAAREAGYFVSVASVKATDGRHRPGRGRPAHRAERRRRRGDRAAAHRRAAVRAAYRAARGGGRRALLGRAGFGPGRPGGGRPTGHRAPAGPGRAHGLARRRAGRLVRRAGPAGRVAGGAAAAAARPCTGRCAARGARPPATRPAGS